MLLHKNMYIDLFINELSSVRINAGIEIRKKVDVHHFVICKNPEVDCLK